MSASGEVREIPGYEGLYAADESGAIYSLPRKVSQGGRMLRVSGRVLRLGVNRYGYRTVRLYREGRGRTFEVHVLVAAAFLGPRPEGTQTRHRDGNPQNLAAANLHYGTPSQNRLDSVAHGTHPMVARQTCPSGHPLDGRTVRQRYCKTCHRAACARYREGRRRVG